MWLRILCLVGFSLAVPLPQELTLKDFERSNGDRSLGGDRVPKLIISAPYRQVRRQGRRGEQTNIKFPTLTVENPNILSIGSPIQKVANENGPVFNNVLSTKDIEGKIKQINSEEEKIRNEKEEKRAEQILKDIQLLEQIEAIEEITELEKIVNLDLQNAEEELLEIGQIDLNTPEVFVEELLPETDVLNNDDNTDISSDILYADEDSGETSDVLYSNDDEVDIPVVVLEEEFVDEPLVDMIDVKVPALLLSEEDFAQVSTENIVTKEGSAAEETSLDDDTSSIPEKDFGLIQEV